MTLSNKFRTCLSIRSTFSRSHQLNHSHNTAYVNQSCIRGRVVRYHNQEMQPETLHYLTATNWDYEPQYQGYTILEVLCSWGTYIPPLWSIKLLCHSSTEYMHVRVLLGRTQEFSLVDRTAGYERAGPWSLDVHCSSWIATRWTTFVTLFPDFSYST